MSSVVDILRDIIDEAHTSWRSVEYDDPVSSSFEYIEDMCRRAIEMIEEDT